ncbi:M14 family zinc carboxypeptidase [Oceanimonas doudoroffii]|uniref:Zinc carboxypeptidase n=1 Tax=Oceanimonas doudoroffii TaxID=84158 RepID=A0A233RJ02_9GAMM|nr:M14 family zinc carboxypeptidase [Oceanimonas doudoroffii]OXY83370.1 zinc carboxypeptidase [Oceanimonas doudoroffii]
MTTGPGFPHPDSNASDRRRSYRQYCRERLPELRLLERLVRRGAPALRSRVLTNVQDGHWQLPVYALELGSSSATAPVLLLCGGVHGIERIGTQLLLAQLATLLQRLHWDSSLQQLLACIRIVICPLLNPVGMARGWRCNGNGIDLMRNAPLEADQPGPWPVSGHRLGPWLPWYRGRPHNPMEPEAQAMCALVQEQIATAPFSLALDCHSGFGLRDRIWFPYSGRRRLLEHAAELHVLLRLFERSHPHHPYLFEPQHHHYRTHGDLWDYLYRQHLQRGGQVFLPLTLEMGSWLWVKKNPRQLASYSGLFNPLVPHRHQRTLRRHQLLLDFLLRAVAAWRHWLPGEPARRQHQRLAERRWGAR